MGDGSGAERRLSGAALAAVVVGALVSVAVTAPAGAADTVTGVDTDGGGGSSLVLDASGNAVVSYYDSDNGALKLACCNDPICAGGDESITTVEGSVEVAFTTSLVLDAAGNPVIALKDQTNELLRLVSCNDPAGGGGNESFTTMDAVGSSGATQSMVRGAVGNPIVAYRAPGSPGMTSLLVAACDFPGCGHPVSDGWP